MRGEINKPLTATISELAGGMNNNQLTSDERLAALRDKLTAPAKIGSPVVINNYDGYTASGDWNWVYREGAKNNGHWFHGSLSEAIAETNAIEENIPKND